jgi:hypothetical protein
MTAITMAAVRPTPSKLAIETMMPSPVSCSCRYGKVGLRLHAVFPTHFPNLRQHEERDDVRESQVGQDVQGRAPTRIRPAAGPQERERRVDLARHQQEDQDCAETAAGDRPLLQVHFSMDSRQKPDDGTQRDDGEDRRQ